MEGSSTCSIRTVEGKGRGLFASRQIPVGTIIETSPVLLFSKEEYHEHGRHTLLDHYTFKWPDGRMALALGLGSLFNHSEYPNVSFSLDTKSECIRYTATRPILPDEELCIFYGHKLWFTPAEGQHDMTDEVETGDDWDALRSISVEDAPENESTNIRPQNPFASGDPKAILSDEELPFMRTKVLPDDEAEDEVIQTMDVWVADIPDSRETQKLLKWVRTAGLETPDLAHLKRVRRPVASRSLEDCPQALPTLLLAPVSSHPTPPTSEAFALQQPYQISVPKYSALTPKSLKLKLNIWPTIYAPRVKGKPEPWSRGKASWAWDALQIVLEEAIKAKDNDEYPIASYVPQPYVEEPNAGGSVDDPPMPLLVAHDTRRSTKNALRHSVFNVVRKVADWRSEPTSKQGRPEELSIASSKSGPSEDETQNNTPSNSNGTHYLLTSLTLFTTHEPCIMCSMALLHSRVKEIIFVHPMDETGGCGWGSGRGTCVPRLPGVNHRYNILRWKVGRRFDIEKSLPDAGGRDVSEVRQELGLIPRQVGTMEVSEIDEKQEDQWFKIKTPEDLDA